MSARDPEQRPGGPGMGGPVSGPGPMGGQLGRDGPPGREGARTSGARSSGCWATSGRSG